MKLKSLLFPVFSMCIIHVHAQTNVIESMSKINIPATYNSSEFRKKLVDEALKNNTKSKALGFQTEVTKQELKKSKVKWLDYINASGNLNEFTLNPAKQISQGTQQNLNFYPRYNFGLAFSLGSIFANANDVQIAKKKINIAQTEENEEKLKLRSLVLAKFEEYVEARELLKLQVQIVSDEETGYKISEKKFRQNQMTMEDFNESAKKYNIERYKIIEIRRQIGVSRYELEGLTGSQLEDGI